MSGRHDIDRAALGELVGAALPAAWHAHLALRIVGAEVIVAEKMDQHVELFILRFRLAAEQCRLLGAASFQEIVCAESAAAVECGWLAALIGETCDALIDALACTATLPLHLSPTAESLRLDALAALGTAMAAYRLKH